MNFISAGTPQTTFFRPRKINNKWWSVRRGRFRKRWWPPPSSDWRILNALQLVIRRKIAPVRKAKANCHPFPFCGPSYRSQRSFVRNCFTRQSWPCAPMRRRLNVDGWVDPSLAFPLSSFYSFFISYLLTTAMFTSSAWREVLKGLSCYSLTQNSSLTRYSKRSGCIYKTVIGSNWRQFFSCPILQQSHHLQRCFAKTSGTSKTRVGLRVAPPSQLFLTEQEDINSWTIQTFLS